MTTLWAGYHIIENKLVKNLNIDAPHMSIVEFLRRINDARIQGIILVYKLNEGTKIWSNPETFARNLRSKLRLIVEHMMHTSSTIIFVVNDDSIIGEERPILMDAGLSLARIFGADRLVRISKGHFYSTSNIP